MKAWHFVNDTLRDGRDIPADGEMSPKSKRWKTLIKIVENEQVDSMLFLVPEEYKKLYALAFECAAWHPKCKYKNNRNVYNSGLCLLYLDRFCEDCPLKKANKQCSETNSLYDRWESSSLKKDIKKHADSMFKLLYKLYCIEYKKVMR